MTFVTVGTQRQDGTLTVQLWVVTPQTMYQVAELLGAPAHEALLTADNITGAQTGMGDILRVDRD